MTSLAVLHTTIETVKPARALLGRHAPAVRAFNLVDDGFLPLLPAGATPSTVARLRAYLEIARDAGAAAVLCCCSSLGAIADAVETPPLPFWRLHDAVADEAIAKASTIGLLATGETPLRAVSALLSRRAAEAGRAPQVIARVASGAFQALIAGREQEHDELVVAELERLAGECEAIVLAQLTIERVIQRLSPATAARVLSSGELGFARAARQLGALQPAGDARG
jgi:aspartate/glutamate racemase